MFLQEKAKSEEVLKGWNGFVRQNHLGRLNKTTCSSCTTFLLLSCAGKCRLCTYLQSFTPTVTKLKKWLSDRQRYTQRVPDHLKVGLRFPIRRPWNNPSRWRKEDGILRGRLPSRGYRLPMLQILCTTLYNAWFTVSKVRCTFHERMYWFMGTLEECYLPG